MEPSISGFCKMAVCFKPGVTLKGLKGSANTVDVEESCVLDVKSEIALIISSDRVLGYLILLLKQGICFAIEDTAYLFNRHGSKVISRKDIIDFALYLLDSWKKWDR